MCVVRYLVESSKVLLSRVITYDDNKYPSSPVSTLLTESARHTRPCDGVPSLVFCRADRLPYVLNHKLTFLYPRSDLKQLRQPRYLDISPSEQSRAFARGCPEDCLGILAAIESSVSAEFATRAVPT